VSVTASSPRISTPGGSTHTCFSFFFLSPLFFFQARARDRTRSRHLVVPDSSALRNFRFLRALATISRGRGRLGAYPSVLGSNGLVFSGAEDLTELSSASQMLKSHFPFAGSPRLDHCCPCCAVLGNRGPPLSRWTKVKVVPVQPSDYLPLGTCVLPAGPSE